MPNTFVQLARDPSLRFVVLGIVICGSMIASVGPYQSLLAIEVFGFSDRAFSAMFAAGSVVGVASSIYIGILTDQQAKRRRAAIFCTLSLIAGGLVVYISPTPASFLLAHLLFWPVGFSIYGQLFALARLAASAHPAETRDGIMTVTRAAFALPFVVILPIWAWAFSSGAPLLSIYTYATFAGTVFLLILIGSWPRDGDTKWRDEKSGLSFRQSLQELTSSRVFPRVFLCGVISSGVTMHMILTGLLFHETPGRDAADTALYIGIIAGLEVPFMLAVAAYMSRISKTRLLAFGSMFYPIFLCAFAVSAAQPWVWALTIPTAFGAAIILSVPIAYLQDLMASRPGAGGSLLALSNVMGQIAAAGVFAIGTFFAGYVATAIIAGLVMATAGVTLYILDARKTIASTG